MPKLKTLLANPAMRWTMIVISAWCGHVSGKALEITSDITLWYRLGTPVLPVRWVQVPDPNGKRDPRQLSSSTDITIEPADIIACTFAETRANLGVETQHQWTDNAIEIHASRRTYNRNIL